MTRPLFQLHQACIRRHKRLILDIPYLAIPPEVHTAIIGPNGAGKSTLLRSLIGLDGGHVLFNGRPVADALRQRHIAWVGQHGHYSLPLNVRDYVLLSAPSGGKRAPDDLLNAFDLGSLATQRIGNLSGGEQQRANLVRALLQEAPALLLDEPCNHLDIRHQYRLMDYLQQQRRRFSVVMVLHDLNLAARYAQHIILMHQGRIVASGSPEDVMNEAYLQLVYQWSIRRYQDNGILHFRSDTSMS